MAHTNQQFRIRQLTAWGLKFLWETSWKNTCGYLVSIAVQVTAELTQLWVAALTVNEIAHLITMHSDASRALLFAALMILLMIADKIAWQMLGYFERQLYLKGSGNIYMKFNQTLADLSVAQHHNPKIRKMMDRLEYEGYYYKPLNFSFEMLYTLHSGLRFIFASLIIVQQLPVVVLLLITGALPVMYIQRKAGDNSWGIWGDIGDNSRVFWGISTLLRNKEAAEEMMPQQSKPYLLGRASEAIVAYTSKAMVVRKRFTRYEIAAGVFEMLTAGGSYVWLVLRAAAGKVTFDNFVFLSSLIWQTLSSVHLVTQSIAKILESVPFMQDFVYFTSLSNDLPMSANPVRLAADSPLTIQFDNVSFRYPGQKKYSLRHVSLTIRPGKHVALVGLNGAGKTTLIRLLLRFYDPSEGSISVNGTDLKDIDLSTYYQHIGTLFQMFNRYPLSFANNITLSPDKDTRRYQNALDISGADRVLDTLDSEQVPLSPDFEHGVDLSGGQWQRVAIARNLYAGGDMFILDEPTSSIDALAEQEIFNKLHRELDGKILITVSHRFNTVRKADQIVVLNRGQIIETGRHDTLIKREGLYSEMFHSQADGYAD